MGVVGICRAFWHVKTIQPKNGAKFYLHVLCRSAVVKSACSCLDLVKCPFSVSLPDPGHSLARQRPFDISSHN